jgi:hypothetical protein
MSVAVAHSSSDDFPLKSHNFVVAMGIQNKLADGIDEVDVIIAGGM